MTPALRVDDEEHEVGLLDRLARLLGHLCPEGPCVFSVDAPGVDQAKRHSVPLAVQLLAVSRDAGRLVHDGSAGLGEPIDERRLADIREADDRDRPSHFGDFVPEAG